MNKIIIVFFVQKQLMEEFEKDELIVLFKRLEDILAKNGSGYIVGKKV